MNDVETRSLRRAAILLLAVSAVRWGWQVRPGPGGPPGLEPAPELLEASRDLASAAERRGRPLAPGERLDPNRAPEEELDRLPGVGPATARAWVAWRDSAGGIRSLSELQEVPGIGPATAARIEPWLDFDASPPLELARRDAARAPERISLSTADETLLQTLPGIGPALARRIVEARRERPFRSVEELLRVRGIGPATLQRIRPRVDLHE